MFVADMIQNIVNTGTNQLLTWMTQLLPQVFLFLIFMNAVTSMIGRARVEGLAAKCGSNSVLRYMVLPFLSAVVLGNPMAISMGRYLPERYKPAYFASASYHCHTNSGIFQHINPAELFLWLGIANGVLARGFETFPLAIRYLIAGLIANFVSGLATEFFTKRIEKKQNIRLEREVDLWTEQEVRADAVGEMNAPAGEVNASAGEAKAPAPLAPGQYRSIRIVCGDGGFGGPLVITPTPEKHTVIYMTGGNLEPEPLAKILALSGMRAINLSKDSCPDEEIALAIVDCGGTLRCGIYPKKGIPTVNIMATGKSGPLARYITEDIYVSAVTSAEVSLADEGMTDVAEPRASAGMTDAEEPLADGVMTQSEETLTNVGMTDAGLTDEKMSDAEAMDAEPIEADRDPDAADNDTQKSAPARVGAHLSQALTPVIAVSKVFSIFQQSARDAVRTCLEMILPFMGFAALFIGICRGSGLTEFLANLMKPMSASVLGLLAIGIICSIPGLSAVLGAGAAAAQVFAAVIGELIATGGISPALALPALFAINCQCACDFIPVGLGMTEAKKETTQVGIAAVTISRFTTGWIRILIALVCSIGLYA